MSKRDSAAGCEGVGPANYLAAPICFMSVALCPGPFDIRGDIRGRGQQFHGGAADVATGACDTRNLSACGGTRLAGALRTAEPQTAFVTISLCQQKSRK